MKVLASRFEGPHTIYPQMTWPICWPGHKQGYSGHSSQNNVVHLRAGPVDRAEFQTRLRRLMNVNTFQSVSSYIPNQAFQRNSQGGCDSQNGQRKCNYATLKQNQNAKVYILAEKNIFM